MFRSVVLWLVVFTGSLFGGTEGAYNAFYGLGAGANIAGDTRMEAAGSMVRAGKYKDNIKGLKVEDAIEALRGLHPVTFSYKASPSNHHVGVIAEDVPDLVSIKDRKGLSPMDIVAVLTKVVQDQQKTISTLREELNELREKVR